MGNKILLVDDSQHLVDAYVQFLQAFTSHEVKGATSGRAALEIAQTWRPDIVVTDVMMPDMNGLELITHMRSEIPPPLPLIVAMSGFPDVEREARHRGAEVFQTKPIDTDELVALIESLIANRQSPANVRAIADGRRQKATEAAQAAVMSTQARRPYFADIAQLGARLLSRYFDNADAAILLIGDGHLKVFASSGWPVGSQPEGVLGYALDVVVSGSTLIVPDLAAMPSGSVRTTIPDWRLLAAVPIRSVDGIAIGVLMVADRRPAPFDVSDLKILEHIAARLGQVFAGTGPGVFEGPGVLLAESWRHLFGCEVSELPRGQTLVVALASLSVETMTPVSSREQLERLERATDKIIERLPPHTALGRLTPERVGAYTVVEDAAAGERALLSVLESLEEDPPRACVAIMSATGMSPTDGGAALLEMLQCLLVSAIARGPATALRAQVAPAAIERRRAA
jgi:CheY-like chemotaxis protein